MIDPFGVAILALAAYRITRLIVDDTILGKPPKSDNAGNLLDEGTGYRRWLDGWAYKADGSNRGALRGWLGDLLTCSFCTGVWVTAGCLALWVNGGDVGQWFLIGAAIAGGQAFIGSRSGA